MARTSRRIATLICFLWAPGVATSARADALPEDYEPPVCAPVSCPEGSTVTGGGHGSCPADCAPVYTECAPDGTCAAGARCVPTRFCILMRPTGRVVQNVVVGECAADASCAEGTCAEVSRCVTVPAGTGGPSMPGPRSRGGGAATTAGMAPAAAPPASSSGGGLCSATVAASDTALAPFAPLALAVALAPLLVARERRRRARRGR